MTINYKKLKGQIKPFKPEIKKGYIFLATDEQKRRDIDSIAVEGSKRRALRIMSEFIHEYEEYREEFIID